MKHELIKLPYDYKELEPFIDAKTVEIHYSKHHQGYVDKLNETLENHMDLQKLSIEDLLSDVDKIPEDIKSSVINYGGGVLNHDIYWNSLSNNPKSIPEGRLMECINNTFKSLDILKEELTKSALSRFGSGWAWLVLNKNGDLLVKSTQNQDNPISEGKYPLLGIDVWEHAYYLKYQNKRGDYLKEIWNIIDWGNIEKRYNHYIKMVDNKTVN